MWLHWFRKASRHNGHHLIRIFAQHATSTSALHARQWQRHASTSTAATHRVMQQDGVIRLEPLAAHDSTILWLHGLGQSGSHWVEPVEDSILPHLPHCRVLLPTAPRRPVQRLQGQQINAWMDSEGHANRFDERCLGLEDSVDTVQQLLDAEIASGTSPCAIVLGGFSQGGALAAHVALRTPNPLAGLLVVNGYLPGLHRTPLLVKARLGVPMLFLHGSNDDHVHIEDGWRAFQVLYTGSMNRDMDSAATLNLRQLWTYDRESRRRPGWADPEQADSDDEGFASLRGRMSISPSVSYDHSNKPVELHGPACLMPHYQPHAPNAAMAMHPPLTSFVTFPGVMTDMIVEWLGEVLGIEAPCPHHLLWQKNDPWEVARGKTL